MSPMEHEHWPRQLNTSNTNGSTTCSQHTSPASSKAGKELQPYSKHPDVPHSGGHDVSTTTIGTIPYRRGSPTCNPGPHRADVQPTHRASHIVSTEQVSIPTTCPRLIHPQLPPMQREIRCNSGTSVAFTIPPSAPTSAIFGRLLSASGTTLARPGTCTICS